MFLFSNICGSVPNLFIIRGITCSSICHSNHYITLGLNPNASQSDIKRAYFELCKKYHPDKNDGTVESTKRFREIAEAYEILGNEKSRKLYDQRMFYSGATVRQTTQRREDYNYEAERHFYERTNLRRRYTGKTAHYDFDAWTKAHYPKSSHVEYKYYKYYGRTWKKSNQSGSEYNENDRTPMIAIKILSFILFSLFLTNLPNFFYSANYGIDKLANKKVENNKSESTDGEFSKQNT